MQANLHTTESNKRLSIFQVDSEKRKGWNSAIQTLHNLSDNFPGGFHFFAMAVSTTDDNVWSAASIPSLDLGLLILYCISIDIH
jgi:hypothetical protein